MCKINAYYNSNRQGTIVMINLHPIGEKMFKLHSYFH